MMRAVGVALLFLSMGAALAGPAAAHDRRVTAGEVRLDGDRIQVRYRVRRVDVTSLGPDAAQWAHHLRGAPPPEVSATLTPLYGAAGCVPEASSFARVAGGRRLGGSFRLVASLRGPAGRASHPTVSRPRSSPRRDAGAGRRIDPPPRERTGARSAAAELSARGGRVGLGISRPRFRARHLRLGPRALRAAPGAPRPPAP